MHMCLHSPAFGARFGQLLPPDEDGEGEAAGAGGAEEAAGTFTRTEAFEAFKKSEVAAPAPRPDPGTGRCTHSIIGGSLPRHSSPPR